MLRDFSLRDFGASLNTVESYTNESSQGKIGLCETANKQKCTHLGMFLASEQLKNDRSLHFDATILDLLKEKLKHSSVSVTNHYTDTQERAFKLICQRINIGLEAVENFIYGG